jgi:hypothetical protein
VVAAQEVTDKLANRDFMHPLGAEGVHGGHCKDTKRKVFKSVS